MELISVEDFLKLSLEDQKRELSKLIEQIPDENFQEFYDIFMEKFAPKE